MELRNRYRGVHPYAVRLVRYHARRLAGTHPFSRADTQDLEQELMLDLLRRLPRFDPRKASFETFVTRLIEHRSAGLLEAARAEKRGARVGHVSLDRPVGDTDDEEQALLRDVIADDAGLWSSHPLPKSEQAELAADLRRGMRRLPPELAALAASLSVDSVTEVSRKSGRPRATVYDAIKSIRAAFEEQGLRAYA